MTNKKNDFHTQCLVSGSNELQPLKGYEKDHLVKSSPLGFVFSVKIPTDKELSDCYEAYSREDYLSPVTVKRYHELLDEFEKYRKTGKLLDVGCGIGLFLNEAKKRGWEVYGTEFTDKALQICRGVGIQMQQGKLEPAKYGPEMFDIITSFEVLEHINNPQEEIKNIKALLRPGGMFFFTTPNFNCLERQYLKGKFDVITYPEHLSYYTKKTADYLLRSNGFRKFKLRTTGISLTRLRTSIGKKENYISAQSSDEVLRQKFEANKLNLVLKSTLNWFLNLLGVGSSLKGWYVK